MIIELQIPVQWDGLDTNGNPEQYSSSRVRQDGSEISVVNDTVTEQDGTFSGVLTVDADLQEGIPSEFEWMVIDNEGTDGIWSDPVSYTYQDAGASKPTISGEITGTPKI